MKKPQSVKTKLRVRLEVLKCSDCGRLVFAVGEKVEGCVFRDNAEKEKKMTLGDLIDKLKRCKSDSQVLYDFGWFHPTTLHSWRGIYSECGIGYEKEGDGPKAGEFVKYLESMLGEIMVGWKGGEYTIHRACPVWAEEYGDGGHTAIVGVMELSYGYVILETRYQEV